MSWLKSSLKIVHVWIAVILYKDSEQPHAVLVFITVSCNEDASEAEPSLIKCAKFGCRWRLRPNFRLLAWLDVSALVFIAAFCAYAIRTLISCTGSLVL